MEWSYDLLVLLLAVKRKKRHVNDESEGKRRKKQRTMSNQPLQGKREGSQTEREISGHLAQ